ncbi:MAG: hypothetical protein EP332_07135 [Bacteroidetes bacterium]|nr:MAG: hypothetical protein EP332_07135 [Bacteroidota bacterium]
MSIQVFAQDSTRRKVTYGIGFGINHSKPVIKLSNWNDLNISGLDTLARISYTSQNSKQFGFNRFSRVNDKLEWSLGLEYIRKEYDIVYRYLNGQAELYKGKLEHIGFPLAIRGQVIQNDFELDILAGSRFLYDITADKDYKSHDWALEVGLVYQKPLCNCNGYSSKMGIELKWNYGLNDLLGARFNRYNATISKLSLNTLSLTFYVRT